MIPFNWLQAPNSYWDATEEEKKKYCNGCGPKGAYFLIPDTLWGLNITEPCNIHDWCYRFGKTEQDRQDADRMFLDNMLSTIDENTTWKWLKKLRRRRARTYYHVVSRYGGPYFRKHQVEEV